MYLKQIGDAIYFGTDEQRHKLSLKSPGHFTAADIDEAAAELAAAYPGEADAVTVYADRLREMVRR